MMAEFESHPETWESDILGTNHIPIRLRCNFA